MSYDPDPKRRMRRLPKRIRKARRGKTAGKLYGRKLRYDPEPRRIRRLRKSGGAKLETMLYKIAMPLGAIIGIFADPIAGGRGINGAIPFMMDRLRNWKMPSINGWLWWHTDPKSPPTYKTPFWSGVAMALGGWIGKQLRLSSVWNRVFSITERLGTGLIIGTQVGFLLWTGPTERSTPNPALYTGETTTSNSDKNVMPKEKVYYYVHAG